MTTTALGEAVTRSRRLNTADRVLARLIRSARGIARHGSASRVCRAEEVWERCRAALNVDRARGERGECGQVAESELCGYGVNSNASVAALHRWKGMERFFYGL
jgi:hypothetical protein